MVTDDAAAVAATLKSPAAGPSARPASVTAVPSKSSRTLFAEEDSESLTLSAKLAALRIEQATSGKADKGKAKDTDFKDAVSDAEDDADGDEDQDASDAARRVNFMDDEDDGLQAHDPKECFEDKAKEDLAAKLRFPLTLLIPSEHLQEVRRTQATVKELLGIWGNELMEHAAKTTFQELDPGFIAKRFFGRMQVIFVNASDANFVWRNRVEHRCVDEKYIVLDWLYPEDPGYTRRKITDPAVIEVLFLGVAAEISPEMLHEALAISPLKICKRPAFKEGFHFHRVVHPVSGLDTDRVKGLVVAHENDQFRWLHWFEGPISPGAKIMVHYPALKCSLCGGMHSVHNHNDFITEHQNNISKWNLTVGRIQELNGRDGVAYLHVFTARAVASFLLLAVSDFQLRISHPCSGCDCSHNDNQDHPQGSRAGAGLNGREQGGMGLPAGVLREGESRVVFFRDVLGPYLSGLNCSGKLMLAGDLNVVEDPDLDKSPRGGSSGENGRLLQLFDGLHMVDAFQTLNPSGREYTFYAKATKSSSMIVRILVSAELLPSVVEAAHTRSLNGISDHKCGVRVVLQASLRLHMGPGIWRLPSADTAKPEVERVIKAVVERHHAEASGSFGGLLTKLKAVLRCYAAEERKRIRATLRHLELAVSGLQQGLMRNPLRDDLRVTLAERESQLATYLKGENDRLHLLAGVKEETKGEIASGVLSAKVKSKKTRTMITVLTSQGVEQRGTRGILEAASRFYAELFAEAPPSGLPCWKPDLLKTLRDREKEELEADWTEEEDLLRKDFMGFIKQFESSAVLPEEVQEAITLLSSCYKVVAKLLANRMKQVLGTVISEEQHGFLPGRQLSDMVSTVADVIETANNDKEDWYLLMIDFQKAFDSVSRSFLFDTMALMGFPSKFIRWCEGLHDGSFTRLLVNGWLGYRVDVRKGVRQGCPLAPYLFLCAVEPICQEAKHRKLGINDDHVDRLAYLGYADDTTLVLKGKRQIERAEELLEEFGARSGLRVNKDKSALLPLGANLKETRSVSSDFAWVNPQDAERLLGVWVSPSGSAEVNWDKALARVAEELVKWQSHNLTMTARVAVLLVNFISGNKASAERHFTLWSRELIFRPRKDGGLGVRDPFVELSGLAARRVGKLVLVRRRVRSWLATKAADLPAGFRSFWAHPEFLKTWKGRSVRWKQTCEMFMQSSIAKKGPLSRWDIAQEPLVFNRQILPNGKKPLGRQEAAKGLELSKLCDFVGQAKDGGFFFKDEKLPTKELGTRKKARRALMAFACVPSAWKAKLIAPIMGEEFLAVSAFVKKKGLAGAWKAEKVVQDGLACRACDWFGVPLITNTCVKF
ncbi:unnamed protein product [Closterium sp. NIES-54]